MQTIPNLDTNWETIKNLLPKNWRELAISEGALKRKARGFSSIDDLIRVFLIHTVQGLSLRETVAKAKIGNIATLSDVALLKRLRTSENFLKALCFSLFKEMGIKPITNSKNIKIRVVDATRVKEPGKKGALWSLHYSINLANLNCDYFDVTLNKGEGNGEKLSRFPVSKGDCIVGDRGYSTCAGIVYIDKNEGYSLIRVNTQALVCFNEENERFDFLSSVKQLKKANMSKEWKVFVKKDNHIVKGRICVIRKPKDAIKKTNETLRQNAIRQSRKLKKSTKEFAKYVIIFTTLPQEQFSLNQVLDTYNPFSAPKNMRLELLNTYFKVKCCIKSEFFLKNQSD